MTLLSYLSAAIDAGSVVDAQAPDGEPSRSGPAEIDAGVPGKDSGPAPSSTTQTPSVKQPLSLPEPRQALRAVPFARPGPASRPDLPRERIRTNLAAGPCVARETAHYRVTFGILGQVAEAELSLAPEIVAGPARTAAATVLVRTKGVGRGDVLGFGKTDKSIESDFESGTLVSRRWSSVNSHSGRTTIDTGEQSKPGAVSLLRKRTGEADRSDRFDRAASVLDPLGFLTRLRVALPESPTVFEVLDGRALWLAKVSGARLDPAAAHLLRIDGTFEPIYWNGNPDKERSTYSFSLHLTRDRFRTPVRLTVPYGLGEVRAELVRVQRPAGERGKSPDGSLACDGTRPRSPWRDRLKQVPNPRMWLPCRDRLGR
jgi:hypothetical protein